MTQGVQKCILRRTLSVAHPDASQKARCPMQSPSPKPGCPLMADSHECGLMYSTRTFVHWYVDEAMEDGEFFKARGDLAALEREYEEVVTYSPEGEEGAEAEY
jgi:hypothetical protein